MSLPRTEIIELPYFGKHWLPNPKQWVVHEQILAFEEQFPVAYVGMCGASRSSKTVLLVNEVIDHALRFPGYKGLLSRWTDEATLTILRPDFYNIVNDHYDPRLLGVPEHYDGPHITSRGWVASEKRQFFSNGSSVYITGLKSGDDANRYAAFDGMSLHGIYVSQAEELPKDVFERLYTRLSMPGFPRLFLFEMNPVYPDFYLFKEYDPKDGVRPADHAFYYLSVYDNRENLPPGFIESLEQRYPPGHPLRQRLIEGKSGLSVTGDPLIGAALFNHDLHVSEKLAQYDPKWPLIISYDPGHSHPCLTWAQVDGFGRERVLDVLIGTEIGADDFFIEAFQRQRNTFGEVKRVEACADKAAQQRHGNDPKTEWDIFKEHLRPWKITPKTGVVASKTFLIERLRSRFTRLIRGEPAIVFHPRCEYLIEGMAGGWVKREPTTLRPTQETPVDNFYAHGADTLLYIDMHFGPGVRKITSTDDEDRPRRVRRRTTAAGY